jgi:hypothetical protein
MGFLHVYMKYTQPLFIQAIMTIKGALEYVPTSPFRRIPRSNDHFNPFHCHQV